MRYLGRWHKGRRAGNRAYALGVVMVAGQPVAYGCPCQGRWAQRNVAADKRLAETKPAHTIVKWVGPKVVSDVKLPPRGAQMRQRGRSMAAEVKDSERYWRTPGSQKAQRGIKPRLFIGHVSAGHDGATRLGWGKSKHPRIRVKVAGAAPNRRKAIGVVPGADQLKGRLGYVPGLRTRRGNRISYKREALPPIAKWLDKYRVYVNGKPLPSKDAARILSDRRAARLVTP